MYIKMERDNSLVVTVNDAIYRGDNLVNKMFFLVPIQVGDIDTNTAIVFLNYIRADGTADIVKLDKLEEDYGINYYQYTFPISNSLTRYPGQVCMFLSIYAGPPDAPVVAKSGECIIQIRESTNMDDYISDRNLTAVYTMHRDITDKLAQIEETQKALAENQVSNIFNLDGEGVVISTLTTGIYNITGTWKMTEDDVERDTLDDDLFFVVNDANGTKLTWLRGGTMQALTVRYGGTAADIVDGSATVTSDVLYLDGGDAGGVEGEEL